MPAYWLLKSEPGDYSFEDLEREGRAVWDGVKNPAALKHMRRARPGDRAFFYHTGKEKAIVGIARLETEAYPDPDRTDDRFLVFEVSPQERLPRPVTLARIKSEASFQQWELVRVPRLSVMPVPRDTWKRILEISRP
ncbi:MAG: EVE domain-containing protein [Gemmatimonadota bacterium]|nr:MAG: EVE domain-containing protein [Gemmatimonadota bacterium]